MRIGIDARFYGETGIGRYIRNLIRELEKIDTENDYIIFVNDVGHNEYKPHNPRFKKWYANVKWYSTEEQLVMFREFIQARLDLVHVPHFNIPLMYYKPMVVTLHDVTMSAFQEENAKGYKKFGYNILMKAMPYKAKKILVPCQAAADEIKSALNITDEKLVVTHEGVDSTILNHVPQDRGVLVTRLEEMRITNKYFLYVGTSYNHKNLNSLIVSYKEILKEHDIANTQLVIAGGRDVYTERLAGFTHALGLDNKVIYAAKYSEKKYVSDRDLAYLYKGALAYVTPSFKEGFSITPLEAQAIGTPVVISDIPVHREIFGESALYFNPKSSIDISDKMLQIHRDTALREKLIAAGYENVKKYSWANMALQTLDVYKSVLNIKK